jgi:hypothetical protein
MSDKIYYDSNSILNPDHPFNFVTRLGYTFDNQEETFKRPLYKEICHTVQKVVFTEYHPVKKKFYLNVVVEYHNVNIKRKPMVSEQTRIPLNIDTDIDHALMIQLLTPKMA